MHLADRQLQMNMPASNPIYQNKYPMLKRKDHYLKVLTCSVTAWNEHVSSKQLLSQTRLYQTFSLPLPKTIHAKIKVGIEWENERWSPAGFGWYGSLSEILTVTLSETLNVTCRNKQLHKYNCTMANWESKKIWTEKDQIYVHLSACQSGWSGQVWTVHIATVLSSCLITLC